MTPTNRAQFFFKTLSVSISLIVCVLSLFLIGQLYPLTRKHNILLPQQDTAINFDSRFVHIISLGQERLISSLLWVETLLNSDLDHYQKNDLKDWMFLRFKSITDLDPYFYESYLYGGIYLSIVKDDDLGAKYIYEKGLQYYPNDFYLNLNASFHYFYELHDVDNSLKCLAKIYKDPKAPRFLPSLYIRLKSTRGDLQSAYALLFDLYSASPKDSAIRRSYSKKLYALKAEIDLECLNRKRHVNCARRDFYGNPYTLTKQNVYKAQEEWEPLRIKKAPVKKKTGADTKKRSNK